MSAQQKKKKKNNSRLYILIAAVVLLIVMIVLIAVKCSGGKKNPDADSTSGESSSQSLEAADIDPLTGLSGFKAQGKRPIAVVVNNSKPARPQWGLCTPDIVFEGVTEAGITRMLWLYSDINKIPDKVGSLRSARHDFVEIAEGLDAIFVHWGGSKYAYSAINERNVDDLDGRSYLGRYFFRDKERTNVAIEHRGYTTREAIDKGLTKLDIRRDICVCFRKLAAHSRRRRMLENRHSFLVLLQPLIYLFSAGRALSQRHQRRADDRRGRQADGGQKRHHSLLPGLAHGRLLRMR